MMIRMTNIMTTMKKIVVLCVALVALSACQKHTGIRGTENVNSTATSKNNRQIKGRIGKVPNYLREA